MCISCCMLFTNKLLLDIHFICILDYGNDVTSKQFQVIFLFELKMD